MAGQPPSGTVTFLLTDLEGSTRLWEQDPEAMKAAMVRHDELLEKTVAAHSGFVFARMGDGMAAAFSTARDAICAAAAFRQALAAEPWVTAQPLRARIGLHTDEAVIADDNGYPNLPVNRCSRLMTAAHGGQIVVSGPTEMLTQGQLPDGMELIDLGEHRLRDLGRPTRIFQLIQSGDREEFPPLRTLDSFPGNLPAQASSFIGRQTEVARVVSALGQSRVVTITGVGGVGKTRLAVHVAAELLPHFREGAWLVELAPVRDPDGVAESVAATFRLARSGPSLEASLLDMLANKELLLVLDNCEHLVGATAKLVTRMERRCPGIVVLATSREGLAVDGEQLIALPPLEAGTPDDDLEILIATDAVNLFVERARHVKADFALNADNARSVAQICQRLDGVPLAIELAAARVIALSPAELVRRLDRRFQVLAGGRRGAVERHATLRAAIDWSYELLNASEQRLLARLAVFSGGCTLEAVEEVCSGAPVEREDVVDLITSLVSRSLVIAEDNAVGTRYRLLETIRQYGEERLAEWGETEAAVTSHARFYAGFSARAASHYYGPEQLAWARQMNLERDNVRVALATAIDTSNAPLAVQLMAYHPHHHGYGGTGEVFKIEIPAERVLELPHARDEIGYPRVLMAAAWHAYIRGDFLRANQLRRQAVEADSALMATTDRPRVELDSCNLTAMAALATGDYSGAVAAYRRGAELAIADGYPGLAAINLAVSVNTALLGGDSDGAIPSAEEALKLARQSGMHGAIVLTLSSLALALADSDPARARALLEEVVQRSANPGDATPSAVLSAAMAAARLSDWELTTTLGALSMQLERWMMVPLQVAPCLAVFARALAERKPEVAGVLQGASYATFRRAAAEGGTLGKPGSGRTGQNFVLNALHDAGDIVARALGDERASELRAAGKGMTMDEAVSFALSHIDARPLTAPR